MLLIFLLRFLNRPILQSRLHCEPTRYVSNLLQVNKVYTVIPPGYIYMDIYKERMIDKVDTSSLNFRDSINASIDNVSNELCNIMKYLSSNNHNGLTVHDLSKEKRF